MQINSIEQTKRVLAEDMKKYVEIILKEYGDFIPEERKVFLSGIYDYCSRIQVCESGTISMFATATEIIMPLAAYEIFQALRTHPEYGSNKNHRCYEEGEIINQTTYFGYIWHVIWTGMSEEEFFRDSLLHETMHFCGAGGSNALREGFAELKTRELAQKYELRASRCGYPKEVEIANRIQNVIGADVAAMITFARNDREIYRILQEHCGIEIAEWYFEISKLMDEEHHAKYNHSEFGGINGAKKKAEAYEKIDYSRIYEKLKMFEGYSDKNVAGNIEESTLDRPADESIRYI